MTFEHVTLTGTPYGIKLTAFVTHSELPCGGLFVAWTPAVINCILSGNAARFSCTRELFNQILK